MMETSEACKILKIELPITVNALKTAFKRVARREHPDHSKHPEANKRFQDVKTAYDVLSLISDKTVIRQFTDEFTVDGEKLSDLGKGLGPTTNGRPCDFCNGLGFKEHHDTSRWESCTNCRPSVVYFGFFEYKCKRCGGDGKYKVNGVVRGDCFSCQGIGWKRAGSPFQNNCFTCHGTRRAAVQSKNPYFVKCRECGGKGELPVWNPVLPKGLIR